MQFCITKIFLKTAYWYVGAGRDLSMGDHLVHERSRPFPTILPGHGSLLIKQFFNLR